MEKGFTRTGRRSRYGANRNSVSEDNKPVVSELTNGSEKEKSGDEFDDIKSKLVPEDKFSSSELVDNVKDEKQVSSPSDSTEFHGFDGPSTPNAVTLVKKLVGKYEADLEDEESVWTAQEPEVMESYSENKLRGQDIYTDSEDENSKPSKDVKKASIAPKKRPLAQLTEEFNDDEKPISPPPQKRARKKSIKAREAAGDSASGKEDISSEVSSSADVALKGKGHKGESHPEVTSSGVQGSRLKQTANTPRQDTRQEIINNPQYLKPFELGWRRELVYRSTDIKCGEGSKRTGDIYYYTPKGKKVRSRREVEQCLTGSDLTIENFTFFKESLGLNDESKETIRDAFAKKSGDTPVGRKKEKTPKVPKQKGAVKSVSPAGSPVVTNEVSNTPSSGTNGTSISPVASTSSKTTGTPRVMFKQNKLSPKTAAKTKVTSPRKGTAESPTSKTKGNRSKKENTQSVDGDLQAGTVPSNWEQSDQPSTEQSLTNNTAVSWKPKSKRGKPSENPESTVESTSSGPIKPQLQRNMDNFISDLSFGYVALFHVMGYLKVQELLRASRVCRMWRDLSLHPNLWRTVRMKNSQVSDWDGFAAALRARGTRVLDLRKMLAPARPDDIDHMWSEFCRVIGQADNLQRIELSRCPSSVVELLATSCPQLRVLNAIAIKSEEVDLESLRNLPLLEELRLKSTNGMSITKTLDPLASCRLRHLSLTSIKNLGACNLNVLSELQHLESLELGDCLKLNSDFGPDHLVKLRNLQRLRLEKGQVPGCPVVSIIEAVSKLPALEQLEIINFDVKPGFDKALAQCKQLRRLLIIPTYITTSASTNHIVLCSIPLLADSLEYLVWGLTQELTRVTDLFIDQCEQRKGPQGAPSKLNAFPGECIPIIKPVVEENKEKEVDDGAGVNEEAQKDAVKMEVDKEQMNSEDNKETKSDILEEKDKEEKAKEGKPTEEEEEEEEKNNEEGKEKEDQSDTDDVESLAHGFRMLSTLQQNVDSTNPGTPPVSILPIPKLHKLLVQLLPSTHVKILKVPFPSTWRQTFPELNSF